MIDAIDINHHAYLQAAENFKRSDWSKRLSAFHSSLQEYGKVAGKKYNLIISNPPFFIDAMKAGSDARNVARHINESLTFEELIDGVKLLLEDSGRFCVILPVKEGSLFITMCEKKGLFCNHLVHVKTKTTKEAKRLLIEFGFVRKNMLHDELVIHNDDGSYGEKYVKLTEDFYTHLPERGLSTNYELR